MHDGIRLTYLGLTELEVRVLKSIFSLAPQLKEDYTLISPQYLDQADLILVNADDPATIRQWSEIRSANKLVSSLAPDARLAELRPESVDGDRIQLSGSSMAAAVVSGLAALMLEQNPALTPDLVKTILMHSAEPAEGSAFEVGAG